MMYSIKLGSTNVFDSNTPGLELIDPLLTQEVNKAGKLTFGLPVTHTHYDDFTALAGLKVYKDDALIFKARIIDAKSDFYKTQTVTAEGALAFLNDSIIRPFDFAGTLQEFFEFIINSHNDAARPFQRFTVGTVDVSDAYVHYTSTDYLSAWEVVTTRLLDTHGGYIRVRYDTSENTIIDYVTDFDDAPVHDMIFGENLIKLLKSRSAVKTYTACIPLGAKTTDAEGNTTDERLTVSSVNDGKDYLVNAPLALSYGLIYAPVEETTWDNVTVAANLLTRGQNYLENIASRVRDTLEVDAVKLGSQWQIINFCDNVHIKSAPHGVDITLAVLKLVTPLCRPREARITLGDEKNSLIASLLPSVRQQAFFRYDGASRIRPISNDDIDLITT